MIKASIFLLLVGLALSLPVAAVLALTAFFLSENYAFIPLTRASGPIFWSHSNDFILIAAPMFIMMGELMHRSGVSERLFDALAPWFARVPGQLIHTNIASSAVFAATSGSSLATAATIGTVAVPNMDKGGYNRPLFLGSIAAGGTLGILIPPSINMIVYSVLSQTSVTDLYAAGFIPGLMLAMLFSGIVLVAVLIKPSLVAGAPQARGSLWPARIAGLPHLLPPLGLFFVVVGSIYVGLATPTEAAALGLMATLGLVAINGKLTVPVLLSAFEGTVRTTCMIMLIVLAAFFLNLVMVSIGLVDAITTSLLGLGWPPLGMLLAIIAFYLVLGCFMETISMMIATTPIIVPVIVGLGYDPVWWGIVFVILIEAALITPPVGLNLYIVQAVRKAGSISDLFVGSIPFLIAMLIMVTLLIIMPGLALWLPEAINPK
ncbi:TRAP transporter large permease [Roseobacter sp.]|uniref:TRAP transporter large permease n=1 Tax=Roseobacter sp. TaxID=1907202 RepID=UPI00329A684C